MNTNQNITIGDSTYNTANIIAKQLNLIEKHIIDALKKSVLKLTWKRI